MWRWLFLCLLASPLSARTPVEVDLQLVLAVDTSRSMSHVDLATQRRGYAEALTSDAVQRAIAAGPLGRIGLTYVEWSDTRRQRIVVGWTLIDSADDAESIADRILMETGGSLRMTSISTGLLFAASRFGDSPIASWRRVIDISGDGPNNDGPPVAPVRDRVAARGITINGLPVMAATADPVWTLSDLDQYYRDCVIAGPGAFVLPVHGWENFAEAIRRKLVLEIAGRRPGPYAERLHRAALSDCLTGEKILQRKRRP